MDYIKSRILDRFSDGGRYFRGEYNKSSLDYILEAKNKFPFWENVCFEFYQDRARQRYQIIKDFFSNQIGDRVLDVGSRDDTAEKFLNKKVALIDKNNTNLDSWDWEKDFIPFSDKEFDSVICLDTMEHINDIHRSIADLFRVSKGTVIISLPNCWKKTYKKFVRGFGSGASYGLPPEKPMDRHKWFFNTEDIDNFIFYNAHKSGFQVSGIVYHMPKTVLWHKIVFPIMKFLPERYAKNLLVETELVVLKRIS